MLTRVPNTAALLLGFLASCVPESRPDPTACAPVCVRTCGDAPCDATCGGVPCVAETIATMPTRSAPVCVDGDANEIFVGEDRPTAHVSIIDRAGRSVVGGVEAGGVSVIRRDAARDRVFFALDQTHSPEVPRGVWMLNETNARSLLEPTAAISGLALFDARVVWAGRDRDNVNVLAFLDPLAKPPTTIAARFEETTGVVERCPNGDFVLALPESGSIVGWNQVLGVFPVLQGTRRPGERLYPRYLACTAESVFFDGQDHLARVAVGGGTSTALVGAQTGISGIVADERGVIWLDATSGTMWRVPAATGRLERVLSGLEAPRGLVVVGGDLLFLDGLGRVRVVAKPDG